MFSVVSFSLRLDGFFRSLYDRIEEGMMARKRKNSTVTLSVPKKASLRQIYAKARAEFSAADLQRYTQDEPMVPSEQLMQELEAIHQEEENKKRRRA